MIKFLSSWAKGLGLAIVIISILEMLLPNNKTKKYIRMVMGMYVIFTMISPLIENKKIFDFNNINLEEYNTLETTTTVVNQTSMDKRIEELYMEELEKDIIKKIQQKGYKVLSCKVSVQISNEESETKINKIRLNLDKVEDKEYIDEENMEKNNKEKYIEDSIENKVVTQIQKIKSVDISIDRRELDTESENQEKSRIQSSDIQNIKKFLIEEYGVSEKCLEIS